jgi:capsular polysaccharide biosynthesis protein
MDKNISRLDLFDMLSIGFKHYKKIIVFAIIIALSTAILMFFQKTKYTAYGSFFPSNNMLNGRVNLMRTTWQEHVEQFGSEDDMDRAYVIGNSNNVTSHLIKLFKMYEHYEIDTLNDPKAFLKTGKKFMKNYTISRSGFKHIEITFTDCDQHLAAKIVNEAMSKIDVEMTRIYNHNNIEISKGLLRSSDSVLAQINSLNDSLVSLRTKYNIYDIISPSRKNIISSKISGSGASFARGLEEIQVVEEQKDKLVEQRASFIALSNEFKSLTENYAQQIQVVQWAEASGKKAGPFRFLTVAFAGIGSLLFAWLLAVLLEYFDRNKLLLN